MATIGSTVRGVGGSVAKPHPTDGGTIKKGKQKRKTAQRDCPPAFSRAKCGGKKKFPWEVARAPVLEKPARSPQSKSISPLLGGSTATRWRGSVLVTPSKEVKGGGEKDKVNASVRDTKKPGVKTQTGSRSMAVKGGRGLGFIIE